MVSLIFSHRIKQGGQTVTSLIHVLIPYCFEWVQEWNKFYDFKIVPSAKTMQILDVASRLRLKRDGTRAETIFRLSAKRTSPFKSAGDVISVEYWQPTCAASVVVMLDAPCSGVVWRVLATHSIRQFPFHFPTRASPCAITFQLESNTKVKASVLTRTELRSMKLGYITTNLRFS